MFRFSILAAILVVLVAGAAMLHSGPSNLTNGADVAFSLSLPSDVIAVAHADVAALVQSELYRSLSERFGEDPWSSHPKYREFVEATGFRFETDLESVTLGVGQDLADGTPPFYVLLDGKFDRKKIDAYILDSGEYERDKLDGLKAFLPKDTADGPDTSAALAWLDRDTLLIASSPQIGKLVRSIDGRAPNAADSVLGALLAQSEGQFRLAMILPGDEEQGPDGATVPPMMRDMVDSMRDSPLGQLHSVMLTLEVGSGLEVIVQAEDDTPESGTAVYDMLNGYLAMGRMMAAENPQLGAFLDHLELERKDAIVSLPLSMTGDQIGALIDETRSKATAVEPAGS